MTNLFGFDITQLDVPWFLNVCRVGFVVLALLAAARATRTRDDRRTGWIVLTVALCGHALAWFASMYPLPGVYGSNASMDRENHLGWANVMAAGFSPLRTFQVHHLHFEPLWPLLMAIASGFEVDRVALVFQWAPLVVGVALVVAIRFAWVRGGVSATAPETTAAFAALGALLLLAVPGDASGPFRNPWALTFLLKPNHALGLVLTPLAALALARATTWKSRLFAGFVLQTVGWAFVIHMAFIVAGLMVFVFLSWITKRAERRRDALDVVTAVGANLAIVSPYLVMLIVAYPFLQGSDAYRLSFFSERPLEGPLRLGLLFLLSAFGAWQTYKNGSRLGRILATQWLGAQLIWQGLPLLGFFGHAREQDEALYWCRFWTGLFAGTGGFTLARSVLTPLRDVRGRTALLSSPAASALILLLPSLVPAWWDPLRMDQYFVAGRAPLPDWIAEPTRFIRGRTDKNAVFVGDRDYARWIAAYGARRVLLSDSLNLPNDFRRRREIEAAALGDGNPELLREGRERYSLQYVLVTSTPLPFAPAVTLAHIERLPHLKVIYDGAFADRRVLIFEIVPPGLGRP